MRKNQMKTNSDPADEARRDELYVSFCNTLAELIENPTVPTPVVELFVEINDRVCLEAELYSVELIEGQRARHIVPVCLQTWTMASAKNETLTEAA